MFDEVVVPFTSNEEVRDPDFLIEDAVVVNNAQLALQMCLELLGARTAPIPVICAVNASPQTASAILRSGAYPIFLDINPKNLQINSDLLKQALEEFDGGAAVVLTQPNGFSISDELIEITKSYPTILDTQFSEISTNTWADFTVFNFKDICGAGVIHTPYEQQRKDLRYIRSGELGYSAELSLPQVDKLKIHLKIKKEDYAPRDLNCWFYTKHFKSRSREDLLLPDFSKDFSPYFMIKVSDAQKTVAHLHSYGIEAKRGCFPLHRMSELLDRWQDTPSYPMVESLENIIVALPCHEFMSPEHILLVVNHVLELE